MDTDLILEGDFQCNLNVFHRKERRIGIIARKLFTIITADSYSQCYLTRFFF